MRIAIVSCSRLSIFLLLLALAGSLLPAPACAQMPQAIIEQKQALSARLDSIELEMQARKRRGESLDALETQSRSIQDSVALLRDKIDARIDAVGGIEAVAPAGLPIPGLQWFEPQGLFDWIVLSVVALAILAALVLLVALLKGLLTRKASRPVTHRPIPKAPVRPPVPPPARPDPPSATSASAGNADMNKEGLENLLLRIHEESERQQQQKSPAPVEEPPQPAAHVSDLRGQILSAARQGLSAQEISRQLHTSVDQVNLILRIADRSGNA